MFNWNQKIVDVQLNIEVIFLSTDFYEWCTTSQISDIWLAVNRKRLLLSECTWLQLSWVMISLFLVYFIKMLRKDAVFVNIIFYVVL